MHIIYCPLPQRLTEWGQLRDNTVSHCLSLSVCVGYSVMTHFSSLLSTQLEGLLNVMETGWDGVSTGYGVMKGREGEREEKEKEKWEKGRTKKERERWERKRMTG